MTDSARPYSQLLVEPLRRDDETWAQAASRWHLYADEAAASHVPYGGLRTDAGPSLDAAAARAFRAKAIHCEQQGVN